MNARRDLAFAVVIVAAGKGRRLGQRKQHLELLGRPLLHWCLDAFVSSIQIDRFVIVHSPDDSETMSEQIATWPGSVPVSAVPGGSERFESVSNGLSALNSETHPYVMIHDVARPLIHPEDILSVAESALSHEASCLGRPIVDSLRRVEEGMLVGAVDRSNMWVVSTPQAFRTELIQRAHAERQSESITDDAELVLPFKPVKMALQRHTNPKITFPGDLEACEPLARDRLRLGASAP